MKHLINKKSLQGGGKNKPTPEPAILRPPEIANFEVLNSYSVAEIVDLISDGPIEGLVNQNGQNLGDNLSILQGVYLDNTPIEVTNSKADILKNDNQISVLPIQASGLNDFGNIYYQNGKYKTFYHEDSKVADIEGGSNIKVDEARLFVSRVFYDGREQSLYSPINEGGVGYSNGSWIWNGSKNDLNQPRYFSNVGDRKLEIHYQNKSLFADGTILNSMESDLNTQLKATTGLPFLSVKTLCSALLNLSTKL